MRAVEGRAEEGKWRTPTALEFRQCSEDGSRNSISNDDGDTLLD